MYSSPTVLDDKRIALIVAVAGKRSIGILDVDSKRLSLIRPSGDYGDLLDYVRQLSTADGRLYFNYDSDERLYKLGVIEDVLDAGKGRIRIETKDYSGGVFSPVEAAGRIYYIGRFSEGTEVCRYPGDTASIGQRDIAFSLEDFDPAAMKAMRDTEIASTAQKTKVGPYSPLAYANPFNSWFFLPRPQRHRSLVPLTRLFQLLRSHGYEPRKPNDRLRPGLSFADAYLQFLSAESPVILNLTFGDNLVYGLSGPPERRTSAFAQASLNLPLYPSPRALSIAVGGELLFRADGEGGSPYTWTYADWDAITSGYLAWTGRITASGERRARGLDITSYHDLEIRSLTYKTEANLTASIESPALRLDLWGAWANAPVLSLDSASDVFSGDRRPAYFEYKSLVASKSNLLAEGALSWRLANEAVHSGLLDLYVNRFFFDAGLRGAFTSGATGGDGNGFYSSAFARASFDLMAAEGMYSAKARVFAEAYIRFDGSAPIDAVGWRINYQTSTDPGLL